MYLHGKDAVYSLYFSTFTSSFYFPVFPPFSHGDNAVKAKVGQRKIFIVTSDFFIINEHWLEIRDFVYLFCVILCI